MQQQLQKLAEQFCKQYATVLADEEYDKYEVAANNWLQQHNIKVTDDTRSDFDYYAEQYASTYM